MKEHFFGSCPPHEAWPLIRDFHYSRRMPSNIQHCFVLRESGGLFGEHGEIVCAAMFGMGANKAWSRGTLELQRLVRHERTNTQLSSFVSMCLRFLRKEKTLRFVFSYADPMQGHFGGIYQATGFLYCGQGSETRGMYVWPDGRREHRKTVQDRVKCWSDSKVMEMFPGLTIERVVPKHLYIFPLRQRRKSILREFNLTIQDYPKPQRDLSSGRPAPSGASRVQTPEVAPL